MPCSCVGLNQRTQLSYFVGFRRSLGASLKFKFHCKGANVKRIQRMSEHKPNLNSVQGSVEEACGIAATYWLTQCVGQKTCWTQP